MKRLLTISSIGIDQSYGPTVHFVELWNEFSRIFENEYEVTGLCRSAEKKPEPAIEIRFKYVAFKSFKNRFLRVVLGDLRRAWWMLFRMRKFDVFYTRTEPFIPFTFLLLKLFNVKLAVECNSPAKDDINSIGAGRLLTRISEFQERLLTDHAVLNIAVSSGIAAHLKNISARNVVMINNGVSSKYFDQKQKVTNGDQIKLIYVGTFAPWSGVIDIIELAEHFPHVQFHIYGDGQRKMEIQSALKTDNVFVHGYVQYKKLPEIYAQFDAGIVLYTSERSDVVLSSIKTLEYMACGLPIFTTNNRGQEFVAENQIGITADFDKIREEFSVFLENLSTYKDNVESFRNTEGQKCSWKETALKTGESLESALASIESGKKAVRDLSEVARHDYER